MQDANVAYLASSQNLMDRFKDTRGMQFLAGLVTKREENVHPYKVQYEAGLPQDGIVGYLSPSDPINPTTWSSETPDGNFHTMPGAWISGCA